jgi:hypothetical protein
MPSEVIFFTGLMFTGPMLKTVYDSKLRV